MSTQCSLNTQGKYTVAERGKVVYNIHRFGMESHCVGGLSPAQAMEGCRPPWLPFYLVFPKIISIIMYIYGLIVSCIAYKVNYFCLS